MPAGQECLLQVNGEKPNNNTQIADVAAVAVPQVAEGLSADELLALAVEGRPQPLYGGTTMDVLMKLVMGGWLPEGKRTQWLGFAMAFGAMVTAVFQWGAGEMDLMTLAQLLKDKWAVFALAYGAYFVGEKIDNKGVK